MMANKIERGIAYILLALGITLGLWFQQHQTDVKFCNITKQTRELRRDSTRDRLEQAKLFAESSFSPEIRVFNTKLIKKYKERLLHDPDLQFPFDCKVNKK